MSIAAYSLIPSAGTDTVSTRVAVHIWCNLINISQTVSVLSTCILGLLSRPDVVKNAHEELDKVIKPGHLPDFDDEDLLPYITAITKESFRWKEPLPVCKFCCALWFRGIYLVSTDSLVTYSHLCSNSSPSQHGRRVQWLSPACRLNHSSKRLVSGTYQSHLAIHLSDTRSRAMLHDEKIYPDPFTFRPERFLKEDGTLDKSVRDPAHAVFGFGRR